MHVYFDTSEETQALGSLHLRHALDLHSRLRHRSSSLLVGELQNFLAELTEGQPRRHHLHKVSSGREEETVRNMQEV